MGSKKKKPPLFPWDYIHPDLITQYPLRMPRQLHAKLSYIVDRTPRTSIQRVLLEAVEREVKRRLRELDGKD